MNRFLYSNWEIYSKEDFSDQSTQVVETYQQSVASVSMYLYRAPIENTKMVGYIPKISVYKGDVESIDLLYGNTIETSDAMVSINLNWFELKYGSSKLADIIEYLETLRVIHQRKKRVTMLGLGDVGSMLAIGLKLLGGEEIESLGIYDISDNQKMRWEMELNQIAVNPGLKIIPIEQAELFSGDVFIFCASKFVPKVGEEGQDVRMIQFEENSKLISMYAIQARNAGFKGVFAVVSDPVDLLCKQVFHSSNMDLNQENYDYRGLLPEQIIGFGLGVMDGRAHYYSEKLELNYSKKGRVFGPHGRDLVVSEDILDENQEKSLKLTERVITANLEMRALGYKPYIAPAISSGAHSIVKLLSGEMHYSANFVNGIYWGSRNRQQLYGIEFEQLRISNALYSRIKASYQKLGDTWVELNS